MKRRGLSAVAKLAFIFLALSTMALLIFAIDQGLLPKGEQEPVLVLSAEECRDITGRYYLIRATDPETQRNSYRFPYRSRVEPKPGDVIEADMYVGPMLHSWAGVIAGFLFWPLLLSGLTLGAIALLKRRGRARIKKTNGEIPT